MWERERKRDFVKTLICIWFINTWRECIYKLIKWTDVAIRLYSYVYNVKHVNATEKNSTRYFAAKMNANFCFLFHPFSLCLTHSLTHSLFLSIVSHSSLFSSHYFSCNVFLVSCFFSSKRELKFLFIVNEKKYLMLGN